MIPFPLSLEPMFGKLVAYLIFLVIGFLFGFVLEAQVSTIPPLWLPSSISKTCGFSKSSLPQL